MMLPVENQRLKQVINHFCDGNVLLFSRSIGVSQPRISRLFTPDKRSNKYPLVSFEIIQATINKYININSEWLIVGKGTMLKKDSPDTKKDSKPNSVEDIIVSKVVEKLNPYLEKIEELDFFMRGMKMNMKIENELEELTKKSKKNKKEGNGLNLQKESPSGN